MDKNQKFSVESYYYCSRMGDGYIGNNLFANNWVNSSCTYLKLDRNEFKELLNSSSVMRLYATYFGHEAQIVGKKIENNNSAFLKLALYKNYYDRNLPSKYKDKFIGYKVRLEFNDGRLPCDVYYEDVKFVLKNEQEVMEK